MVFGIRLKNDLCCLVSYQYYTLHALGPALKVFFIDYALFKNENRQISKLVWSISANFYYMLHAL